MRLIDKVVNRFSVWRFAAMMLFAAAIVTQVIVGAVYAMSKQVCIADGQNVTPSFVTYAYNVAGVLASKGVVVGDGDEVEPALDMRVHDGDTITVTRAKTIILADGTNSFEKRTAKRTVAEVLEQFGIEEKGGTVLNLSPGDEVSDGMTIEVGYLDEKLVEEEAEVAYKTVNKASRSLSFGETKVSTEGKNGVLKNTYRVFFENGTEVARELVSRIVSQEPVDKVVEYGVTASTGARLSYAGGSVVSRSGGEFRYSSYIDCSASAYDLSYASCGKNPGDRGYGVTASGMKAQYGVVAVDPRVIPLGTRLYIEAADGSWVYGNAVAGDTGGGIRGNRVDLFFNTYNECIQFGRRKARVYILE